MKVSNIRQPVAVLSLLFVSLLLAGCLGGGIDPNEDPVQPSGENAEANPAEGEEEASENNAAPENNAALNNNSGEENNVINNSNNLEANGGGNDGEAVNNAADENFLDNVNNSNPKNNLTGGGNNQGNLFGGNGTGNNNPGKNNFGLNQGNQGDDALINGAGGDILEQNVNKGAIDSEPLEPASDANILAPVAENPTVPAGGAGAATGVVRYVTPGGSKLYNRPNGEILRNLEQGDHPLVNEEGEWSRTSDGYYVPSASLTAAPIPRFKQPKSWR